MEDMAEKITKILEDDKSVDMLKNLTQMFGSSEPREKSEPSQNGPDLGKIMQLANGMKEDDRLRLMRALRPFVSEQKRESLDSITNVLRIVQLMSLLGNDFKLF